MPLHVYISHVTPSDEPTVTPVHAAGGVPVQEALVPVPLRVQVYVDAAPATKPTSHDEVTLHVAPTAPSLAHPDKPAETKGGHLTATTEAREGGVGVKSVCGFRA